MKLLWHVRPAPTGPYSSFQTRGWPGASYPDGKPAVQLCSITNEEYRPARVRAGEYDPLGVSIADWRPTPRGGAFTWRRLTRTFVTLDDAKRAAEKFLEDHPEVKPKEETQ